MITINDVTVAAHTGQSNYVFLRSQPDQYGRLWALHRWDDSRDWHLVREHLDGLTGFDPEIAEAAMRDVALRCVDGAAGWTPETP